MGISAVILTKNEESRIRRCLEALIGWVDEVILVDDESTDRTPTIAEGEYGARVIVRPLANRFDAQRNAGSETATHSWILQMDADEVIPPSTAAAIQRAVTKDEYDAFAIRRQDCVFQTPLKHVGASYQLRIFKKGKAHYEGIVHEALQYEGRLGRIEEPVYHYPITSIADMVAKQNFYTDLECTKYLEEHPDVDSRYVRRQLTIRTIKVFIKHYFKHKACKDGAGGLVWALIHTLHPVLFWMKVLEQLELRKNAEVNAGCG